MKTPIELLFKDEVIAEISKFGYATPWASAHCDFKEKELIFLYKDLGSYLLEFYPESNELLYHTHALTSVYSITEKLSDGFCMIPIYSKHLNLGFNKGTLLDDPHNLLHGTGKLIRHIPIQNKSDYRNPKVKKLIQAAIDYFSRH